MRNHRLYEVKPERNVSVGGWKVVTGKGTCVKRTTSEKAAVREGTRRAKMAASNWGINTTLRVRDRDGYILDETFFDAR